MKILTVDEVARIFKLTRVTIYRMAKAGDIPALKIGRVWRFPESAIEAWLSEKMQVKGPQGAKRKGGP